MKYLFTIVTLCFCLSGTAQYEYKFQNPDLPIDQRVDDLVSQLTVEEKINQLLFQAPAIPRLGIPEYNWWNECLHGVARAGYATVFPQSISIAASWNKSLIYDIASSISDEARAKHHDFVSKGERGIYQGLTFWSPNINIFRDPRWGRGHETYGEDPFLTGEMGKEFVLGLQGGDDKYLKVIATAKHFAVHSGPEPLRHGFDAKVEERDLQETYLPAFRSLVVDGGVYSVMGAYNRLRGEACCASPALFSALRDDWGFKGYVVSDCGAINDIWQYHDVAPDAASAAAMAVREGCDLECGSTYKALHDAHKHGLIKEEEIDRAVKRLFLARFKLGMFDPVDMVEYARIPFLANNSKEHDHLALQAAKESIVLLKNDRNILPLDKNNIKTIAVIGPNADEVQSLLGNYSGVPINPVTLLDGIRNKVGSGVKVLHAQGSDLAEGIPLFNPVSPEHLQTPEGAQGLYGEYFNNDNFEGKPLFTKIDKGIDFVWDIDKPDYGIKGNKFSVRWSGFITPPETGTYLLSGWGKPYIRIIYEDTEVAGGDYEHHPVITPIKADMEKGKKYKIQIEFRNYYGDATARLLWAVPRHNMLEEAVETAKNADIVILTLGLNERLEGEEMKIDVDGFKGGDRTHLNLPRVQEELMKAICATGKPTVLVLLNGSALSINWAATNIPAILTAGYPGQQGGNAVADVLFGDYNPAGRLPVTYYKSVDQLPPFEDYDMKGRTYRYFKDEPLYPFGYGLSYTFFKYGSLSIPKQVEIKKPVKVSVTVTNVGKYDGDEVVQLYLTDEAASTTRPIRQLEGFERIHLKKGESKVVTFYISPRQLSMINNEGERVIEPGWFSISVGGQQPGFSGTKNAYTTSTSSGRFEVVGEVTKVK